MWHQPGSVLPLIGMVLCWRCVSATFSSSGCDATKFCRTLPDGCETTSADCVFFSWIWNPADGAFEMELSGGAGGGNTYAAVGFGQVDGMQDADLYYCTGSALESGVITTSHQAPTELDISTEAGINITSTSSADGVAQCKFRRAASITKTISAGLEKNFNLTAASYYILLARGGVSGGSVQYHGTDRSISEEVMDLAAAAPATTPHTASTAQPSATQQATNDPQTSAAPQTTMAADSSGCGSNKECFQLPTDCREGTANCVTFTWTYDSAAESFAMVISGGTGNGAAYAGVAFSEVKEMKDADLYYCTGSALESGVIGKRHDPPTKLNSTVGVSASDASTTDGVAKCTFTRPSSVTKTITTGDKDFDLTKAKYYILLAHGAMQDGNLQNHGVTNRIVSDTAFQMDSGGSSIMQSSVATGLLSFICLALSASLLMQ